LPAESKIAPHGVSLFAERSVFAFEFVESHGGGDSNFSKQIFFPTFMSEASPSFFGSVDRRQNAHGTPILEVDSARGASRRNLWIRPRIAWTRSVAMRNWKRFSRRACIVDGDC
ncbi:MAG: hypothetical protein M3Z36_10960, partial [Acidobacteriota bacterium]|nr:hypothetical protein [Acidobacteriota bacterium]